MPNIAAALLVLAVSAIILPPGYPAYVGAYASLAAAIVALLFYGWREREVLSLPSSLAILAAVGLVAATVPMVYQGPQDLLAPVLIAPMLASIGIAALGQPANRLLSATTIALLCLMGAVLAVAGGLYEHGVLHIYRSGLGNNPIHYASLAAMVGCLALVGIADSRSPWRYVFFLGPVLALVAAGISDSRGPFAGALVMTGIGIGILSVWHWRERSFRLMLLVAFLSAIVSIAYVTSSGSNRVAGILNSALNVFRFTGSSDDIRAALYSSALASLWQSPIFGVGFGQMMDAAQALFPERQEMFLLGDLHADWANFATMAGGLGLLAWLLLLAAPALLLVDRRARADRPIVLGIGILTAGQLTLGVSNATFGILPQTVLYGVVLGYLMARLRHGTIHRTKENTS